MTSIMISLYVVAFVATSAWLGELVDGLKDAPQTADIPLQVCKFVNFSPPKSIYQSHLIIIYVLEILYMWVHRSASIY